jgi:hypothetical protein
MQVAPCSSRPTKMARMTPRGCTLQPGCAPRPRCPNWAAAGVLQKSPLIGPLQPSCPSSTHRSSPSRGPWASLRRWRSHMGMPGRHLWARLSQACHCLAPQAVEYQFRFNCSHAKRASFASGAGQHRGHSVGALAGSGGGGGSCCPQHAAAHMRATRQRTRTLLRFKSLSSHLLRSGVGKSRASTSNSCSRLGDLGLT